MNSLKTILVAYQNGERGLPNYHELAAMVEHSGEPVEWLTRRHETGEHQFADANEKASNPKYWTDAFPVFTHPPAQPIEQLYALLDKAASLLTESALSEDYDGDEALELVAAIRGEFVNVGKTTVENDLEVLWEKIRVAAGFDQDDEFTLSEAIAKISAPAQPVPDLINIGSMRYQGKSVANWVIEAKAAQSKPMHEQNARFAIDGAIAYGMQGVNKPPESDHWLMEYWEIGQKIAAQAGQEPSANVRQVMGSWFECHTIDEMQAFYLSRLPAIREAAKEHGYAIGLHGSTRRDFDLMAMQWREDCSTQDELAHAIAKATCGITREGLYQWEVKPMGRIATSFPVCWTDHSPNFPKDMLSLGHIDLSIIAVQPAPANAMAVVAAVAHKDHTLPFESVLSELIGILKIDETGDILNDAKSAAIKLNSIFSRKKYTVDHIVTDSFEKWWRENYRKLYGYSSIAKCNAVWNASISFAPAPANALAIVQAALEAAAKKAMSILNDCPTAHIAQEIRAIPPQSVISSMKGQL